MAGYAYQQDDELDRKQDDQTRQAPGEQGGQRTGPDAANQSLAEIDQLYPDGAGGMLDVKNQMCVAPEVDQLALHGAATETSHVDPIAASVAQAELETKSSAPVAPAAASEANEGNAAEGPETGTVQAGKAESPASAQDGLPSSPATVLSGAATGLTTAVAETPAASGKQGAEAGVGQAGRRGGAERDARPGAGGRWGAGRQAGGELGGIARAPTTSATA